MPGWLPFISIWTRTYPGEEFTLALAASEPLRIFHPSFGGTRISPNKLFHPGKLDTLLKEAHDMLFKT